MAEMLTSGPSAGPYRPPSGPVRSGCAIDQIALAPISISRYNSLGLMYAVHG